MKAAAYSYVRKGDIVQAALTVRNSLLWEIHGEYFTADSLLYTYVHFSSAMNEV
jgi:hypothetical protein